MPFWAPWFGCLSSRSRASSGVSPSVSPCACGICLNAREMKWVCSFWSTFGERMVLSCMEVGSLRGTRCFLSWKSGFSIGSECLFVLLLEMNVVLVRMDWCSEFPLPVLRPCSVCACAIWKPHLFDLLLVNRGIRYGLIVLLIESEALSLLLLLFLVSLDNMIVLFKMNFLDLEGWWPLSYLVTLRIMTAWGDIDLFCCMFCLGCDVVLMMFFTTKCCQFPGGI